MKSKLLLLFLSLFAFVGGVKADIMPTITLSTNQDGSNPSRTWNVTSEGSFSYTDGISIDFGKNTEDKSTSYYIRISEGFVIKEVSVSAQGTNTARIPVLGSYYVNAYVHLNGGNSVQQSGLNKNPADPVTSTATYTNAQYTYFKIWNSTYSLIANITNITVKWERRQYTVSFNGNGVTNPAGQTVTYGKTYGVLPQLSQTDKCFVGWYDDDEKVTSNTIYNTVGDKELTARWATHNSFDADGVCTECGAIDPARIVAVDKNDNYLYTNIEGKMVALGKGANWGTRATLEDETEPVKIEAKTENNLTRIKFDDKQYLFDAGGYNLFTDDDQANAFIFVSQPDGGYKIFLPNDTHYAIGHATENAPANENADGNNHVVMKLVEYANADVFFLGDTRASLSCKAGKYGTFVAPFDVTLPEGMRAFGVSDADVENGLVVLEEVDVTSKLDANTPVLVWSEDAEIAQYCYGNDVQNHADTPDGTGLVGVYADGGEITPGSYVLQTQSGVQQFFKVGNTPVHGKANRCYLHVPNGGSVKAFTLGNEETAVKTIEALTSGDAKIYDINGRRLSALQKGINVVNGHKVLVK